MVEWLKKHIGSVDEDGWSIQWKHFVYHPHSYGIATLMRIGVRSKPGGYQLHIHHFKPHKVWPFDDGSADPEDFHDHPWDFRTFVLWGGYVDERLRGYRSTPGRPGKTPIIDREVMKPGMTRKRLATHAHRTSSETGAVTLVFTWPKSRTWCRGTPDNWVCGGKVEDFDSTRGTVKITDG